MVKIKPVVALIAVGLLAIAASVFKLQDRIRSPWAFDEPALVGSWAGAMVTPTGKRSSVYLTIRLIERNRSGRIGRRRSGGGSRGYGRFNGEFIVCESDRHAVAYSVDGNPSDRHGANFTFFASAKVQRDGLAPGWVHAAWDSANRIDGRVDFSWHEGSATISGPDYPDTQAKGTVWLRRASTAATIASCAQDAPRSLPSEQIVFTGPVTDAAYILDADQEESLAVQLRALEQATGHQMVVATVPDLDGQDIAIYAQTLANRWGVGRKHINDGVVILVAPKEGAVRIAVGLGLERTLPDSHCQQIMNQQMIPRFKQGDIAGGIDAGVKALLKHLG